MDPRERFNISSEPWRAYIENHRKHMWSNGVGLITENSDGYTVKVQPAIKGRQVKGDESIDQFDMPVLEDIPILHFGGGGVALTMPIAKGDEVLLNHSSRPIDTWWQSGGSQPPIDLRNHHISDAIAIPGLRSTPRKMQGVSTNTVQLRTTDGTTTVLRDADGKVLRDANGNERTSFSANAFIELEPGGNINIHSSGEWNTDVPVHNYTGVVKVTGDIVLNGISLKTHKHNNVQPGGGLTGPPISSLELMKKWGISEIECHVIVTLLVIDILARMLF